MKMMFCSTDPAATNQSLSDEKSPHTRTTEGIHPPHQGNDNGDSPSCDKENIRETIQEDKTFINSHGKSKKLERIPQVAEV